MDNREEMRRLIDVIEKGANNSSLSQAIDDIKLFSNTASFLANKLDTRLRNKAAVKKRAAPKTTKTVVKVCVATLCWPRVFSPESFCSVG